MPTRKVVREQDNIINDKEAMRKMIENHEDANNAMYHDGYWFD